MTHYTQTVTDLTIATLAKNAAEAAYDANLSSASATDEDDDALLEAVECADAVYEQAYRLWEQAWENR